MYKKNIPEIKFCFSSVYNSFFEKFVRLPRSKDKNITTKDILKKMSILEKEWKKIENKILKSLTAYTNLQWSEKIINCYFVENCIPFSDPLTICPYKNNKETINLLIHELIHRFIYQNRNNKKVQKMWKFLEKRYKKESMLTINHIIVHAIHSKIYLEYFDNKELNYNIEKDKRDKNYARSWEIVNDLGYKKIIDLIKG